MQSNYNFCQQLLAANIKRIMTVTLNSLFWYKTQLPYLELKHVPQR